MVGYGEERNTISAGDLLETGRWFAEGFRRDDDLEKAISTIGDKLTFTEWLGSSHQGNGELAVVTLLVDHEEYGAVSVVRTPLWTIHYNGVLAYHPQGLFLYDLQIPNAPRPGMLIVNNHEYDGRGFELRGQKPIRMIMREFRIGRGAYGEDALETSITYKDR
jgi:hypothetical protein